MVESPRGYHLVQIVDLMVNVRALSQNIAKPGATKLRATIASTAKEQNILPGILGGGLRDKRGKLLKYKIETMGCQMNVADSERIEGQLQSMGIMPVEDEEGNNEKPDLVVLNTCSIRDHAEQKVYS